MPSLQPQAAAPQVWPVRMRGLPFDAMEQDIAEFFYPLPIAPSGISIKYMPSPGLNMPPRPKGEAMVTFASAEVRELAMERHKQLMRTRYIELFEASESDLLASAQQQMAAAAPRGPQFTQPMMTAPMGMMATAQMQQGMQQANYYAAQMAAAQMAPGLHYAQQQPQMGYGGYAPAHAQYQSGPYAGAQPAAQYGAGYAQMQQQPQARPASYAAAQPAAGPVGYAAGGQAAGQRYPTAAYGGAAPMGHARGLPYSAPY
ncbi:hypothetical protein T492DRAFT_846355 [Pavlovales sp. CCMP2436]|nr:hypothetical protein T492DRAFT_846355 [Pavlovales sp. CCMP2436]